MILLPSVIKPTRYTIVPLEDFYLWNLRLIAGIEASMSLDCLIILFGKYLSSLNLLLFCPEEEKSPADETVCQLIDEIKANGDVKPPKPIPDEVFKNVFYDSLVSCEHLPDMEEMIEELPLPTTEFEEIFRIIERDYRERLWGHMLRYIPPYAIESFVQRMAGCDLPDNFIERMKLSPLLGLEYVQSQRKSDFGNDAVAAKLEKSE